MPGYAEPADRWLAQKLGQLSGDVAALKAQGTTYILNAHGECRAIVGQVAYTSNGESTGLAPGFGIAVSNGETWTRLTGASPFVTGAEAVNASATANVSVRLEEGGASARLEGDVQATGAAIAANTSLFTIPAAYQPREGVIRFGGLISAAYVTIEIIAGVVSIEAELPKGDYLEWGSITYSV